MLELDSVPADPPKSGVPPHAAPGASLGAHPAPGAPILVVEDDESILAMVLNILRLEGYPASSAVNGLEGLREIERVMPSLILLDMRMPHMDGWEFARIFRARGGRSPIVVMTAAENARAWASEVGAVGYVTKPFDYLALLEAIERHRERTPRN
jgi:CheY-like chemotaxis protein